MPRSALTLAILLQGPAFCAGCEDAARETKPPAAAAPAATPPQTQTPPPAPGDALAAPPDLNAPPADAQKTASGLVTRVLTVGSGHMRPGPRDSVRVHYTGWKSSGKLIDSSRKRGEPAVFELGGVIAGWAEGLQLMRVGETRRLWIPAHLSYVRPGRPGGDVVFDIELLEIIAAQEPPTPPDVAGPPDTATRTESGLAYRVLQDSSTQERPHAWDRVTLRHAGWTPDGELFELSDRSTHDLDDVMPGWSEALQSMGVGERWRLWIPPDLAYRGRSGRPQGMVVFDLELLSIERRPEPPRPPEQLAAPPEDATKTPSGLAYRVVERGQSARHPATDSRVKLHYSGWTSDGQLFDSTVTRGHPKTVALKSVIPGWREGLQHLTEGDRAILWIPEALAYQGAKGAPRGPLVYELHLLEILE
jgi:FKBP-type peptidyl-prolyl cis-trans isomerase